MDIADLLANPDAILDQIAKLDCEERLLPFVRRHWRVLEPVATLVEGWALDAVCEHLEAVTAGHITKLLINVPPGFMKSLLTNVFWPAWEWGPKGLTHHRYVTFSYAASLTERDNGRFRDLLVSPEFQRLWQVKLTKVGEVKIQNNRTGWKFASSIGGVGTGERGDRILLDDPHNVKEGESDPVRQETCRWFRESMSNRLNDIIHGATVVIMQRVHEADVSGEILTAGLGYEHLMIPMEWDRRAYTTSIGWRDPRAEDDVENALAWPERFPQVAVDDLKKALGEYGYAAQYQQLPAPRGGGILRRDWWRRWDETESLGHGIPKGHYPHFDYVVASLDTAYTEKQENDYSAMTVWGLWRDRKGLSRLMLMFGWHERLALNDLVTKVIGTCRKHRVDRLLIEAKASGQSAAQEIRRLMYDEIRSRTVSPMPTTAAFGIELINPRGGDKVARAHSVTALFEEGLIWAPGFDDGTFRDWAELVVAECAVFPKGAHDDLVDSVTQAIRYLRNVGLAERPIERETRIKEKLMFKGRSSSQPLYPA